MQSTTYAGITEQNKESEGECYKKRIKIWTYRDRETEEKYKTALSL